ncbi:metallophosphoesterase family protein [Paenibacillus sp. NEAU-GSW1]|uniref:metallophosphoesterase family protein n=1 Tax=Paenibacillus sp. NEAU-GSW1 TaxID=2682486 RepID=UPI0012E20D9C|nr:metallophosphoesterase family protein [Paenibacillus sp. NEAU-GSW1]MUT68431.1 serine/threonine protein phosphatase [Paenibacillus sp. NEAU-GSW1]
MKERTLVISDIHGCYDAFNQLLELTAYDPAKDKLLLLGDFVDKGPDSRQVVEQTMSLVRNDGAIAIQGNHDERLVDVVLGRSKEAEEKFFKHGGYETFSSYTGSQLEKGASAPDSKRFEVLQETIKEKYMDHIDFLEQLPYYYEDEDFIYVHAGLNPRYADWKKQPKRDFLYMKEPFHSSEPFTDKKVIFGHTKTIDLHGKADIWFGKGKIGIDGGCSVGLQLNALEIRGADSLRTYKVPLIK